MKLYKSIRALGLYLLAGYYLAEAVKCVQALTKDCGCKDPAPVVDEEVTLVGEAASDS